ncbi:uncharacterized protein T551_01472 [Pneumocystis jirovecii RU7]|uniref:Uncharacterized protein n=1 Tax=Pneumocystis jirovecii (strain RU7) TaxID=1408657 RepID=A0A0W4ZRC6_PNEJ7|nr:uncharacterized protein T551_01472 [Pneumocystis jirovecii RU7]KTW30920.1 hypothetical protein T551_01472 [Pneumocystis jirovecii RU7]
MTFLTKSFFFQKKINKFCIKRSSTKTLNLGKNVLYPAIQKHLKLYETVNIDALVYGLQDFSNAMDSLLPEKKFKMIRKLQRLYGKPLKMIVLSRSSSKFKYSSHFERKNSRFLLAQMAECFKTFDKESILGILNFSVYSENVSETLISFYLYKIYSLNKRNEGLPLLKEFLETLINSDLKKKLMNISAINIAKLETRYLYEDIEIPFSMMFEKKSLSEDIYNMVRVYILKIYSIQGKSQKAIHILGELVKARRIPSFSIMNILLRTVLGKNTFINNIKRESDLMFFYNKIFSNLSPNFETIKILANCSLTYNEFDKLWRFVINHPHKNKIIEGCQIEIARAFLRLGQKVRQLSNSSIHLNANAMNFLQYLISNVKKLYKNTIIYLTLCCSLFDNFIGLKQCFKILNSHHWELSTKHYATIYRQAFNLNFENLKVCRHEFVKHLWMQNEQKTLISLPKKHPNEHSLVEYVRCMGSFNDLQEILRLIKKEKPIKKGTIIGFVEALNLAKAHTESLSLLRLPELRINMDLNIIKCFFNNIQTRPAWNDILHAVSIELARNQITTPLDFFANLWEKTMHQNCSKESIILKENYVVAIKHLVKEYTVQLNKIIKELQDQRDIESALTQLEAIDYSCVTTLHS